MPSRMTVYLAGPDVFLPDAIAAGQRKKRLCAQYGFQGLYPFDNEVGPTPPGTRTDRLIYHANATMIEKCDFAIANLTPFRGVSADPGTVFELGLLVGLGKPILGYTNDASTLLERLQRAGQARYDDATQSWRDLDGMAIEDFGNADNLMLDTALAERGFPLMRHAALPDQRLTDLTAFEACLRLAAAKFRGARPRRVAARDSVAHEV